MLTQIAAGRPVNTTGDPNDWDAKTTNERLMTLMSTVNSATFEGDCKYLRYRMLVGGTGWHVDFDEMERPPLMPKAEPGSPSIRQFSVTTVNEIAKPLRASTLGKSDGHGTHLTTLLLRVAPSAEIYVARVADNSRGLASAEGNISQAIRIAAMQWDVDLISMSFGLAKHVAEIRDAIRDATHHKRGRITFFAAAANDGLNRREMFPANFGDPVISVHGTNRSGAFEPDFNPPTSASGPAFGTLAKDVYLDWIGEEAQHEGSLSAGAQMLLVIGAKMSGKLTRGENVNYSMRRVQATIYHSLWARTPLYLIAGIKVAEGFSVSSSCTAQRGSAAAPGRARHRAAGRVEASMARKRWHDTSFTMGHQVILAYQLLRIARKGWRERRLDVDEYQPKSAFLGAEEEGIGQ
ncbi:hypothetical protein NHJ13734_009786 [Beauveria thailandica]